MKRRTVRIGIYIALCCAGMSMNSRARPTLTQNAVLPASGIRLRVLSRASQIPLPPPRTSRYTGVRDGFVVFEDRYDPYELWFHDQFLARWKDPENTMMTLAVVKHSFPANLNTPVRRENYRKILAQYSRDLTGTSPDSLAQWISKFTGKTVDSIEPLRFLPYKINSAARVAFSDPRHIAYLFQARHRLSEKTGPAINTFLVHFSLAEASDLDAFRETVETRFFEALEFFPPETPESDSAAARELSNLEGWWHIDTRGYTILSNQKLGNRSLIEDLRAFLDPMRQAYELVVPAFYNLSERATVRIFSSPDDYQAYVGKNMAWSGGVWDASRRELVIRPTPSIRYRETREKLLRTIFHEAFHQYLYYAFRPHSPAAWFNEGHAALFEFSKFSRLEDGILSFEEHPPYVEHVGELPLRALLTLSYREFYASDPITRQRNYAAAWSFIYYLRGATASESGFVFSRFLEDYLAALSGDVPGNRQFPNSLKYDVSELERDYLHFWQSPHRRRAVSRASLTIPSR